MKWKGKYKKPALPSQIEGRMVLELKRGTLLPSTISRPGIVTAGASDWMRASHMTKAIDQSDDFLLWRK